MKLFYTQFSPLNAGIAYLGFFNFKIFWGSMLSDTPWKCGLMAPVDTVGNSIQTLVLMCKCAVIVIHACVVSINND